MRKVIKIIKRIVNDRLMLRLCCLSLVLVVLMVIYSVNSVNTAKQEETDSTVITPTEKVYEEYMIEGVPVIKQEDLKAGCETYACTMLLQSLHIDMDEFEFADSYLLEKPVYGYGEEFYGPDMDSAYAGEIEWGYGINAPAMAKCMNNMLKDKGSKMTATALSGVELDTLCKDYIVKDVPVMVWATTNMQEPYVKKYWSVNFVDEEVSDAQIGDIEQWLQNEHCMVLIGFDKENYYFADSVAGEVSVFEKETSRDKYAKLDMQAIVVK
ncbi:MAG: C39 family peptidase [Ruminococcus sp.]|nr:C39 family peptidase [Ruminococcus sp.]